MSIPNIPNRVQILKQKFINSLGLPNRSLLPESTIKEILKELKIKYRNIIGVFERWLQTYVNTKYAAVPHQVGVPVKKRQLTIQCNEMWSFVSNKGNKQWVWLALDVKTAEIVEVYVGDRSGAGTNGLWQSLPGVYRQCANCYTDFWSAYEQVIPQCRIALLASRVVR